MNSAIRNLSLSDPRCNQDSCLAFQAAHNLSQKTVSYALQYQYGHWTAWYYAIIIFLFAVWNGRQMFRSARQARTLKRPKLITRLANKVTAAVRYVTYRRFSGASFDRLGLPSVGLLALLLMSILVLLIMTFAVRPYYRQHRGYGSPPLGVRTGLMAAACTPLIVALAGKANFVTLLTGIGHERLNTLHRWVSWMCFGLSVAHTVPFIVAPLKDGGPKALHKQYYKKNGFEVSLVNNLLIFDVLVVECLLAFVLISARHDIHEIYH